MYNTQNYLVPTLNAMPYDHKPPLLFWIIVLFWKIFGVNETIVRFIPLIFSTGVLVVGYKIYKLLWSNDKKGANSFGWVLSGSVIFLFYSTLLMFDIMLSFWVALAIYGGLKAILDDKLSSYLILTFAIGFGILAKSPVILAHLLPLYIFAFYISPNKLKVSFYIKGFLSVVAGILIALIWAIPAAIKGGDAFAYGIFWGQYAGRAVNSFAHKRAFWWYLPWIPLLLFPWFFYRGFWNGLKTIFKELDFGLRVVVVWIGGTFVIFSLISGKQLAYIAPEFLAFAILATRAITKNSKLNSSYFISFIYLLLGVAMMLAPNFIKGYYLRYLDTKTFIISGIILIIYSLFLAFFKFKEQKNQIKVISIGSILLIFILHFNLYLYLKSQDLTNFAKKINSLQNKGVKVAHYGKYHNQYHFVGRLKKPLIILNSAKELNKFIQNYPNGAVITYKTRDVKFNKDAILGVTKFRTQNALLVKAKKWNSLIK
jgi:4-amino-4-deoxy-L-arabinose transferase-like glycosyltransferase